jgi:hypothetical protein
MLLEMVISGLTIDPVNNSPIVLLQEKNGSAVVPIWIGAVEASAIAFELEGIKLPRPMTHDLLKSVIEALGGQVERVAVVALRDNTYFAVVEITQAGRELQIDARPSDAIALALRVGAPVFCDESVVAQAPRGDSDEAAAPPEGSVVREEEQGGGPKPIVDLGTQSPQELLENLSPEAFGKYKM